jgi:hypothetical protein
MIKLDLNSVTRLKLLILVDDRNQIFFSTRALGAAAKNEVLVELFKKLNYDVRLRKFSEIDILNTNYKDFLVMYQSTEDPGLLYKDYIEDILLGLQLQGAIIIPEFKYFRAHHNKVFMEILRPIFDKNKDLLSMFFGTLQELVESQDRLEFPLVLKSSEGARSEGVFLIKSKKDLFSVAKKVTRSFAFENVKMFIKSILKNKRYLYFSNYRRKIILQKYIPGLTGDFKVLIYWDKYYIVERKNRANDFRASGSGKLNFPKDINMKLLDYSMNIFETARVPYMGLDIAIKDGKFYLLEFQFVGLGNYALEKSDFFFTKKSEQWSVINKKSVLENEIVGSFNSFVKKYISNNN